MSQSAFRPAERAFWQVLRRVVPSWGAHGRVRSHGVDVAGTRATMREPWGWIAVAVPGLRKVRLCAGGPQQGFAVGVASDAARPAPATRTPTVEIPSTGLDNLQ